MANWVHFPIASEGRVAEDPYRGLRAGPAFLPSTSLPQHPRGKSIQLNFLRLTKLYAPINEIYASDSNFLEFRRGVGRFGRVL